MEICATGRTEGRKMNERKRCELRLREVARNGHRGLYSFRVSTGRDVFVCSQCMKVLLCRYIGVPYPKDE